ncbi:MAG: hypothetical protein LBG96_11680 [Tannerella sp.]|nr:hypothetical protein [Tannerella sp.]
MTVEQAAEKWLKKFHAECAEAGVCLDPQDNDTRWSGLCNGKYRKELYVSIDDCWTPIGPEVDADYEAD